jgi:hypothetical protein
MEDVPRTETVLSGRTSFALAWEHDSIGNDKTSNTISQAVIRICFIYLYTIYPIVLIAQSK